MSLLSVMRDARRRAEELRSMLAVAPEGAQHAEWTVAGLTQARSLLLRLDHHVFASEHDRLFRATRASLAVEKQRQARVVSVIGAAPVQLDPVACTEFPEHKRAALRKALNVFSSPDQ